MGIKSIYIAGPMQNDAQHEEIFNKAEDCFSLKGFMVFNPVRLGLSLKNEIQKELEYADFLLYDLGFVKFADMVYMLKGWEYSPGATAEHAFARALGKQIMYEN